MNNLIIKDWLPPVLYKQLGFLYSQMEFIFYANKNILSKNKQLKGQGRGKKAFLLTTGPSIKMENLKLLQGEDCFSVSNFFLHEDIGLIKPKFHFFAPYHPPLVLENYAEWLQQADKQLPPESGIFLGHQTYELIQQRQLFPGRDVHYLYLAHYPGWNVDITQPVLNPVTGPLMLLPLLIYMEYEVVYLLGCDHTVLRDYGKAITHFYDSKKDIRVNASDKNSWENIINSHHYSLKVFQQYDFYRKIIEQKRTTRIVNLSQDSWLDLFPFDRLENVVSIKKESIRN